MQSNPPQLQRVVAVLVVGTAIAFALHIKCNQRQGTNFDPSPKGAELVSKVCVFSVWLTLLGNELGYATRSIVRKCHSARSNGQALGHLGSWAAKIHSTNCQSLNFSLVSAGTEFLSAFLSLSTNPTSCRTYKLMISAKNFLPLTVTVAMAVTAAEAAAAAMATGEEVDGAVRVRVGTFGK